MNKTLYTLSSLLGFLLLGMSLYAQPLTDSISRIALIDESDGPDSASWQHLTQPLMLAGDKNFESFGLLDSTVTDYQFFFTGEEHYQKINSRLQWQFLRYLHQRANVRTLILESGYSYGVLVNEYLETGNEKLLDKVLAVAPICPENQRKLFRYIYRYNQSLPSDQRISVLGIDLEYEPELCLQALNHLMPSREYPKPIARSLKKLYQLHHSKYYNANEVKRFFRKLEKEMEQDVEHHLVFWGDAFPTAAYIVENTVRGQNFNRIQLVMQEILEDKSMWQEREQRMFENFLLLRDHVPQGNYYGQFGTLHAYLSPVYWDFPSIARKLNTNPESPVKGKVLSIVRYIPDLVDSYRPADQSLIQEVVDYVSDSYPGNVVLARFAENLAPLEAMSQYMLIIDPELQEPSCE